MYILIEAYDKKHCFLLRIIGKKYFAISLTNLLIDFIWQTMKIETTLIVISIL